MSGLSDHLLSGQTGAPVGCGENQAEEKGCVGGLEGPDLWTRELRLQEGSQDPSDDGLAPVTSDLFPPSSPSALANGLHLQRRLGHNIHRRRQTETHTTAETHTFAETLRNMQTHIDPDAQAVSHALMDNGGNMDINAHMGTIGLEQHRALSPEAIHTTSVQPLSLALGNHPASNNRLAAPVLSVETDIPSTFCPVPISPNPNTDSSPLPVEAEKKYALRSSGRPRFPCHLRKSSRLRRSIEDGEKRVGRERGGEEEDEVLEDKIWRVKEKEVAVGEKEEQSSTALSVEAVLPTAPCPTDIALALTVSKPVPKAIPKPGPRLGHKPGPKSRSRPGPKSVHKAAPKSVMKQRQAAQAIPHRVTSYIPFVSPSTISAPQLTVKEEPVAEFGTCPPNNQRRGRFVGVS